MTEFNDLYTKHAVLLDVSSLSVLHGKDWREADRLIVRLGTKDRNEKLRAVIHEINRWPELQSYLLFLEKLIVFEFVVFDKCAAEAAFASIPEDFAPLMRGLSVPEEIYRQVSAEVQQIKQRISDFTISGEIRALAESSSLQDHDPFWSFGEKKLHDRFDRNNVAGIPRTLAHTNDSFGRAVFYLEFSRALGLPAVLSDQKSKWLSLIREKIKQPIHERVVKCVDEEVRKSVNDFLAAGPDLDVGPVVELIIRHAIDQNTLLSAAALHVRQTPEAMDFRRLLLELCEALSRGREGWMVVGKVQQALRRTANIWATHLDPQLEVTRKRRVMKLDKLPILGGLLAMASMSDVEIRDVILSRPPSYLGFISSWYA